MLCARCSGLTVGLPSLMSFCCTHVTAFDLWAVSRSDVYCLRPANQMPVGWLAAPFRLCTAIDGVPENGSSFGLEWEGGWTHRAVVTQPIRKECMSMKWNFILKLVTWGELFVSRELLSPASYKPLWGIYCYFHFQRKLSHREVKPLT